MSESGSINYFGVCPQCGRNDGYLNSGRERWFVCHEHRVKWGGGQSKACGWKEVSPVVRKRNVALFAAYREIEPRYPDQEPATVSAVAQVSRNGHAASAGYRPLSPEVAAATTVMGTLRAAARVFLQEAQDAAAGIAQVADSLDKRLAEGGFMDHDSLDFDDRVEALASLLRTAGALVRRAERDLPF